MPRNAKYGSQLANLKAERDGTPAVSRGPGRPLGKRSDKAYKGYSVLLRRESQRKAHNILREEEDDDKRLDFSSLIQQLLDSWLAKQKAA